MKLTIDDDFDLDAESDLEGDEIKRVGVLFEVINIVPDSTEYKIISPTIVPKIPLFVRLELDEEEIIEDSEDVKIITQDGFMDMLMLYAKKLKTIEMRIKNG